MESNLLMLSEPSLLCLNDPILSCLLNSLRILSLSQLLVNHRSGYRTLAEQKNNVDEQFRSSKNNSVPQNTQICAFLEKENVKTENQLKNCILKGQCHEIFDFFLFKRFELCNRISLQK